MEYRLFCLFLLCSLTTAVLADSDAEMRPQDSALLIAIYNEDADAARAAVKDGADVNCAIGEDRETPLHAASRNGQTDIAMFLVESGAVADPKDKDGVTPLMLAAENGHQEIVSFLRGKGAAYSAHCALMVDDVTAARDLIEKDPSLVRERNRYGEEPLYLAAEGGHTGMVTFLLENGADVNATENLGLTPLWAAAANGHTETARLLIDAGARVGLHGSQIMVSSPLHAAAENGHKNVVKLLLQKESPVDAKDSLGMTPLDLAAEGGHREIADLLLLAGAEYTLTGAASIGNVNRVRELLDSDPSLVKEGTFWAKPLERAAENGHVEVVRLLLEWGADPNADTFPGVSPLYQAAGKGHAETVKVLLAHGANPNKKSQIFRLTALHKASEAGHCDVVETLLVNGADPNATAGDVFEGVTPLHSAAGEGHQKVAEILLARGADPTIEAKYAGTPARSAEFYGHPELAAFLREAEEKFVRENPDIHDAVATGNIGKVRELIEARPDLVNAKDERKRKRSEPIEEYDTVLGYFPWEVTADTPLHVAAQKGHREIAELLISRGAVVDATNDEGKTPLHTCAENGHLLIAELLVSKGAAVNATHEWGNYTPLHYAAEEGHSSMVRFLLAHGGNLEAGRDAGTSTPLRAAAKAGHVETVKLLLDAGADPNSGLDQQTPSALHEAVSGGHTATARLLIEHGADVNTPGFGFTPLQRAVLIKNLQMVELLISCGADPNQPSREGSFGTPLHTAAEQGEIEIAEYLISKGAKISATDSEGMTPLHYAAREDSPDMVRFLLSKGADATAESTDGLTTLHMGVYSSSKEIPRILVEAGADVNAQDNEEGATPLMMAAVWPNEHAAETAEYLIEQGADVMARNKDGFTALHAAAKGIEDTVLKVLLRRGADTNARAEKEGITPLHVAATAMTDIAARTLLEAGANPNTKDSNGKTPLDYAREKRNYKIVNLLLDFGAEDSVRGSSDFSTDESD